MKDKKRELADLDADLEDFMHVATDGNYNLKILNDAFEGRAHENEELDLINVGGEVKIKKRTKRPAVRPQAKTANVGSAHDEELDALGSSRDPRMEAIVEEVMRQSATDGFGNFKKPTTAAQEDSASDANSMALVPMSEEGMKRQRNERLKLKAKAMAASENQEG